MYKPKSDKYKSARGGHSRILALSCSHCAGHIGFYQKDGPGMLKRLYLDRLVLGPEPAAELSCGDCNRVLGVRYTYEKEQRPAYRLFAGAVTKRIVAARSVPSGD